MFERSIKLLKEFVYYRLKINKTGYAKNFIPFL
jgi:hypothetical protein